MVVWPIVVGAGTVVEVVAAAAAVGVLGAVVGTVVVGGPVVVVGAASTAGISPRPNAHIVLTRRATTKPPRTRPAILRSGATGAA